VTVDDEVVGSIGPGLLVLLGVTHTDTVSTAETMARKVHELRILRDERSAAEVGAPLLVVSQFTLYGDTRKGNRPAYVDAARPEVAEPLYDRFCERLGAKKGVFGACMGVALINDGPVTVMVEMPPASVPSAS
jgi:D-tyrosyl-tRNA(Tyr) deacylase